MDQSPWGILYLIPTKWVKTNSLRCLITDLRPIYKCKTTQKNLFKQENMAIMITELQSE